MVFNTKLVVSVAKASADAWQYLACLPETINNQHLLDLVLCFPLEQLGRFALCFWSFFCVPSSPDSYYLYHSYNRSDSSSSDSDSDSVHFRRRFYRNDPQYSD
ncbi:hypothetical protein DCAR_0727373 [Daucus carota subsp. sativus]|uniref:Uncharacterized protein n=1 Tax=Daucus carota subsp. sativus TaxID=79200 RepID=A0A161ZKY6_DAUCS|nr:PREDICTED: uncharacterized protein LOC108194505 [Daucus carota subsp. sativus]WOH07938.1 hypothetical protein DCAR_0727373 [Daucus carota subsp. sativus]